MNDPEIIAQTVRHWQMLGQPIRPSPLEIAAVARPLSMVRCPRVLVLGGTPEWIDWAVARQAQRILAMDWHAPIFPAMRILGREDWSTVEFNVSSWLAPQESLVGCFDIVVGDGALNMLTIPDDWRTLLHLLTRYLVPGGLLAGRVMCLPDAPIDFPDVLRDAVARFDRESAGANAEQQVDLFRNLLAEIRVATGAGSVDEKGQAHLDRRMQWEATALHTLARRYQDRPFWEIAESSVGSGGRVESKAGRVRSAAYPRWRQAQALFEDCGLQIHALEWIGDRPVPGIAASFAAQRNGPPAHA